VSAHPVDFPVCLRLEGRRVLLVGAGSIAEARAQELVAAGARLTVVSPAVAPSVRQLADAGRLTLVERAYVRGDVHGHQLVFSATDDLQVSLAVAEEARALGVLLNAADEPDLCDFTLPSVGRRGPITVAVSTAGLAPTLARHLRQQFSAQVAPHHVHLARLSGWLRERLPRGPARMKLLRGLVEGDFSKLLARGQRRAAKARLRAALQSLGETS
jgi:precorrin-2 dehydrogenase/sirohydrochlorin ferrochelatase